MCPVPRRAFDRSACSITSGALLAAVLSVLPVHADSSVPSARETGDASVVRPETGSRRRGYVIGDLIEQRALLTARSGFTLDRASLPALRRENLWLTLVRTTVRDWGGEPHRYEIVLQYQLSNAPLKVRGIELPDVHVRFKPTSAAARGRPPTPAELEGLIGAQRIIVAPIVPADVPLSTKLLRADRLPQPLSTLPERLALGLGAGLAGVLVAAHLIAPALRRRRGPFARAYRRIRRAVARAGRAQTGAPRVDPEALRALHRAFDQTAGWSVFHDRLGAFFAQHRRFAGVRDGVERFLEMSQREFFESREETRSTADANRNRDDLLWLLDFARECRACERQVG